MSSSPAYAAALALALVLAPAACTPARGLPRSLDASRPEGAARAPLAMARATLVPLGQSGVGGTLTFTELAEGGVKVEGRIVGLKQEGLHGMHVHAVPDCSAMDGASAGPHFNPTGQPHGDPATPAAHLGDLGNVQANAAGVADVFFVRRGVELGAGDTSLVGHSVIVHRNRDDMKSQPAGGAGDRIACGVIKAS